MQSKARMTIRFEPPKPTEPKKPIRQSIAAAEKLNLEEEALPELGFTSLNSPYQDDIHALEDIIRKTEFVERSVPPVIVQANARQLEKHIQAPYPILKDVAYDEPSDDKWSSEISDNEYEGRLPGTSWLNRTTGTSEGPSWSRVFLSVTAAVATGALFGYLVLSLFTGEPLFPGKSGAGPGLPVQASPGKSATPSTNGTNAIPKGTGAAVSPESAATSETSGRTGGKDSIAQVRADVYYMLQYGVFQSKESMQTAVNQLQDKGLASATETSDGYRVYVGAAMTRDEAEALAAQMSGIEVYVKPLEGEPVTVSSETLPEGLAPFMNATAQLARTLTQLTGTALQDKQPRKMDTANKASLQEVHQQWLNTVAAVDKLDGKTAEDGKIIVQALNSAVLSVTEFNRKPSRSHLWTAQSAVMKALLADRHLRLVLQPEVDG
ncbi:SPOR domain-containing protein [Cohnella silvisoli]|uniref:SPOR domain-containing protein n=1 Tax=Cohnella silvisoli TaxID=2873699 RepID=A0ABV1KU34_9BACL|nr:SPOR domain-containing protein [Cohnella silvisoli]MCD9022719.1 SPOR domain-containing protein [Cohnella silvisoli]